MKSGPFRSYLLILALLISTGLSAQYFGQNKPRYRTFDFQTLETPHYSIYHYMENREYLYEFAKLSEQWYHAHQRVLRDTFHKRNPLIIYNNHADFQQTNVIFGSIGVGTGGVTEALKNRVVMPITMMNQQTHHVLGHELVHAFQYHMVLSGDSTTLENLGNLPLWMVEGMAEYMSLGRKDPATAMWMRDAVLHDDIPSIKDLYRSNEYFPYRYGQAFWAFLTGLFGDDVIRPMFMGTAKVGLEAAIDSLLPGFDQESLSEAWRSALKTYYTPYLGDMEENYAGRKIISSENSGEMNISPSLSPNGRYVIFLSEKNLFTTDLYIADARSGKNIRKITSILKDNHLDDISFFESSGTWSPDSKQFAFVGFEKGRNVLVFKDPESGNTIETIVIKEVPSIANPVWSPDGNTIVFTGMVEAQPDLYAYNLKTRKLKKLTNDAYSEIQPDFNADGSKLVFATDKLSMDRNINRGKWTFNIAVMGIETGDMRHFDFFKGADNLNPQFDHEGNIYFLSDRDGFRNLYRVDPESEDLYQMTEFLTGISGITKYSPAISVNKERDRVIFSHYEDDGYNIYYSDTEDFLFRSVEPYDVDQKAGYLPVVGIDVPKPVAANLEDFNELPTENVSEFEQVNFKGNFKLDYIGGSTGIGLGTGTFGTQAGLAGGIDMLFTDILGNHLLHTQLALNGDILDFGGVVQYLNRKNRVAWGAAISHIPIRTGFISYSNDTLQFADGTIPVIREDVNILRIFDDQASLLGHYAFNQNLRLEASAGINYRFYRLDVYPNYYDNRFFPPQYIGQGQREREELPGDEIIVGGYLIKKGAFYTGQTALVGDNASFGLTAPLNGYRFRFDVTKYLGRYDMLGTTADMRGYQWLDPISIAARIHHFARYGPDSDSYNPILIGWMGLVHGYDYNQIIKQQDLNQDSPNDVAFNNQLQTEFQRLSGSKFILSSVEIRMPFTGPERLALIKSGFLFSDLNVFFDAGVAFDQYSHFSDGEPIVVEQRNPDTGQLERVTIYRKPKLALSTGVSLRVNLFGALVLEPYVAIPLSADDKTALFGLNFIPGW